MQPQTQPKMQRKIVFFLSVLALITIASTSFTNAINIDTESNIKAVTVYQNRAILTREASVNIPKGDHRIVISNLPSMLDPNTIRVSGKSAQDIIIGTVKHDLINTPELTDERAKELNTQMQTLTDQLAMIEAEKRALNTRQQFLQSLGKQAQLRSDENIAELNLNTDQWADAADTIGEGMADILKGKVTLDIKTRDLKAKRDAIQAEMNKLKGGRKNYYEVSIAVEAATATKLDLELSYQMHNASWRPVYDARLNMNADGKTTLDLIQFGNVYQSTGEDWNDIELTLSTAQPHRSATLPALRPNWVSIYAENARSKMSLGTSSGVGSSVNNYGGFETFAQADSAELAAAPVMQKAATHKGATIESNGFTVEYKIAGLVDVPSDGSESKLRIGNADIKHQMETHIRPQLSQNAFWVANVTLQGDAPLLAGEVSLYRDDAFIGKSSLPFLMPNKGHDLSFGINDQITVAMKPLKEERKEAGMVLSSNTLTKHLVTEVENIGTRATSIILQKHIPTSIYKELEVEIDNAHTTKDYVEDVDNLKGILEWKTSIEPSQEQEFKLGYELSWPKGYNIQGRP